MFEPIRGGTRGGQAEFKWSDVSADKDREHYLGHSINAPTGRWQKNKDVHWYNRDANGSEDERLSEIQHIKQLEADALAAALGFEQGPKEPTIEKSTSGNLSKEETDEKALQKAQEKEEKRRRKAERREAKNAKKTERKARDRSEDIDPYKQRIVRNRSRSLSPHYKGAERSHLPRRRSRERDYPPRSGLSPSRSSFYHSGYGAGEREQERERDRRRWDSNARREPPPPPPPPPPRRR